MTAYHGRCLCGDVSLVAKGLPLRVGLCHCRDCQKHHGAVFFAAAVFTEDAVTITGETGAYEGRQFCQRCGSSVFSRTGEEVEVHLGILDDGDDLVPTYELWGIRRNRWLPSIPGSEVFARNEEDEGAV